jgi:hypothetical protein
MLYQLLGGGAAIFAMVSAALSLRGTGQPFPWEKTPDKSTEALTRWNQWAAVCACFAPSSQHSLSFKVRPQPPETTLNP